MTNQEIEQAAKEFVELQNRLNIIRTPQYYFRAGAEMVNQKQPYSPEDMIEFGVELLKRTHVTANRFVIRANLKLWEESRNG